MAIYLMNKLDYQRLRERIGRAKMDATTSRSQLINLTRRVLEAKITEPADVPADIVTMNSQVLVANLDSGQTFTIQLAYPELADPGRQQVSILAPLATALLGSREGEVVGLKTPYGSVRFCIKRILYQPEAAGDFTQ